MHPIKLRRFKIAVFTGIALGSLAAGLLWAQDIDPASNPNVPPYTNTPVSGYQLAWSDEFNTNVVNEARWNYRTGVRFWSVQQPQNNAVTNGVLQILLKKETVGTNQCTSGGLISKKAVRYGY